MSEPTLYELTGAIALEKAILAYLDASIGYDHPAHQSTRARIAAIEKLITECEDQMGYTRGNPD